MDTEKVSIIDLTTDSEPDIKQKSKKHSPPSPSSTTRQHSPNTRNGLPPSLNPANSAKSDQNASRTNSSLDAFQSHPPGNGLLSLDTHARTPRLPRSLTSGTSRPSVEASSSLSPYPQLNAPGKHSGFSVVIDVSPRRQFQLDSTSGREGKRRRLDSEDTDNSISALIAAKAAKDKVKNLHREDWGLYNLEHDKETLLQASQPRPKAGGQEAVSLVWTSTSAKLLTQLGAVSLTDPKKQAKHSLAKQLNVKGPLLALRNDRDSRKLDTRFEFIRENIIRRGVHPGKIEFSWGCSCVPECGTKTCDCLRNEDDEIRKVLPYREGLNETIVLRDEFIESEEGSEIVECNQTCLCDLTCSNRVVQKGRTIPLEIFMTEKCGFGLRTLVPVQRGQFIDTYLGEVITTKEADYREAVDSAASTQHVSYVFQLDYFEDEFNHNEQMYHIDGRSKGSATRFINHSCDPNCRIFPVRYNRADNKLYTLAFFAIKDLRAGTELRFDYIPQAAGTPSKNNLGDDEEDDIIWCRCGAPNCRGRLWPNQKRKTRG